MGGVGSDIAVDAADIALVNDDIKELPHLFAPGKAHDGHHQMQFDVLHGPKFHCDRLGDDRHFEPCGRRAGP